MNIKYNFSKNIEIDNIKIGNNYETYFIADIAANHDGNLNRAIDLIHMASRAGANAAKFQHFNADSIVSDPGFKSLKSSSFMVFNTASSAIACSLESKVV